MTLSWRVPGTFRIRGTPTNLWLRNGDDIPAMFSVVDSDGALWSGVAFVGDEMRQGRAALPEALAAALDAAAIRVCASAALGPVASVNEEPASLPRSGSG